MSIKTKHFIFHDGNKKTRNVGHTTSLMLTLENEGSWMEITPPIKYHSLLSVFAEPRVYIEELHFQTWSN